MSDVSTCNPLKYRQSQIQDKIGLKVFLFLRKRIMRSKFWIKLAWLLPEALVYFCAIRLIANATQGKYGNQVVPELTAMDALKRWEENKKTSDIKQ